MDGSLRVKTVRTTAVARLRSITKGRIRPILLKKSEWGNSTRTELGKHPFCTLLRKI
jgi:hypothetical protein